MAARHKKHGGKAGGIMVDSGDRDVIKEAEEKKRGGKVMGKMHGGMSKHRLDRPGRKRGGRVGSNMAPLSTAHSASSADAEPKSNSSR